MRSFSLDRRIWPISVSSFNEKRSWYTFSSERAATDKAVTNLSPPLVKMT